MSDAAWPLQQAVYTALTGAGLVDVKGNAVTVYDLVPEGVAFPYVAIGEDTAIDWSAKGMRGEESTLTVHVWSRYRGRKETKLIMAAIKDALHEQELSVSGENLILLRWEYAETFLDDDGLTMHGVCRVRALTHE